MKESSKLKRLRRSRDVNGEEMRKLLGFKSIATYYKKESGSSKFTIEEANIIAKFFGTTIEDLFVDSETEGVKDGAKKETCTANAGK